MLVNQSNLVPTRKVAHGGIGGAISLLLIATASATGWDISAELASALTTLATFVFGYFSRERA